MAGYGTLPGNCTRATKSLARVGALAPYREWRDMRGMRWYYVDDDRSSEERSQWLAAERVLPAEVEVEAVAG